MAAAKKKNGASKLAIEGELTIYTAADTKEKLAALFASDDTLEVDLAQVAEIDAAGLQLLLLAQREATKQNKRIAFINPSEAVSTCWQMCNVTALFNAAA